MTASKMPKPRPPVFSPEQEVRAIDQRNEQARAAVVQAPKVAPKPRGGAA